MAESNRSGGTTIALIVGGVVVAAIILYFLFFSEAFDTEAVAPVDATSVSGEADADVDEPVGDAADATSDAVEDDADVVDGDEIETEIQSQ